MRTGLVKREPGFLRGPARKLFLYFLASFLSRV